MKTQTFLLHRREGFSLFAYNGCGFMSVLFLPNSKNKKDKNKIALNPML